MVLIFAGQSNNEATTHRFLTKTLRVVLNTRIIIIYHKGFLMVKLDEYWQSNQTDAFYMDLPSIRFIIKKSFYQWNLVPDTENKHESLTKFFHCKKKVWFRSSLSSIATCGDIKSQCGNRNLFHRWIEIEKEHIL